MIPSRGKSKGPCVKWTCFQTSLPTPDQIKQWDSRFNPERWGFVTGHFSTIVGIDFDGEHGLEWMKKWDLKPNLSSGSGGCHVYFQHPGWHVPTLNAKTSKRTWPFPGVDVRGDGGFIVLLGSNKNGPYKLLDNQMRVLPADELPEELRLYLWGVSKSNPEAKKEEIPEDPIEYIEDESPPTNLHNYQDRPSTSLLLDRTLASPSGTGRNNDGAALACQLRDNGYSEAETLSCLYSFQSRVPSTNARGEKEAYTRTEAQATVHSIFSRPPRDPWTQRSPRRDIPLTPPDVPTNSHAASQSSAIGVEEKFTPYEEHPSEEDAAQVAESLIHQVIESKDSSKIYGDIAGAPPYMIALASCKPSVRERAKANLHEAFGDDFRFKRWDIEINEQVHKEYERKHPPSDPLPDSDWRSKLIRRRRKDDPEDCPGTGGILLCEHNAMLYFENHPSWNGVLGYNAFTAQHAILKTPPDPVKLNAGQHLEDHHDTQFARWLQIQTGEPWNVGMVRLATDSFSRDHSFHPPLDYLNSLPKWKPGDPERLKTWLFDYAGAGPSDTEDEEPDADNKALLGFISAAGERWMISAVARMREPGCEVHHMLVLEGGEGLGKSTLVRTIGKGWSKVITGDLGGKSAQELIASAVWIWEFAELASLKRTSEVEEAKAFITNPEDTFRPAYGRRVIFHKRQCAFIATVNTGEYLDSAAWSDGKRRIWPIHCVRPFDIEGLVQNIDMLWAEADYKYNNKHIWHFDRHSDIEVINTAKEEQMARVPDDAWKGIVEIALEASKKARNIGRRQGWFVSGEDIVNRIPAPYSNDRDKAINRVGRVMKTIKTWERVLVRHNDKSREWLYYQPKEKDSEQKKDEPGVF